MSNNSTTPTVPLWDLKACASFLNVCERTVQRAVALPPTAHGSIPHARVGRALRFDPDEIKRWFWAGGPPVAEFRANARDMRQEVTKPDKQEKPKQA